MRGRERVDGGEGRPGASPPAAGRRALQTTVGLLGLVAVVFGTQTVLLGARSVLGAGAVSANLDNELRFYAAWYVGAGLLLLRSVPRVEAATTWIRGVAAVLLLAASGRLLSLLTVGRPHPGQIALMLVEFAIPLILVPWQTVVARRWRAGRPSTR
ncbi:MAG TPA: DUF4345 domain-containing protein [Actinomycetota bacterium]|nr:DUF4345 domain-containing protein [Actinomycetota bacterium]